MLLLRHIALPRTSFDGATKLRFFCGNRSVRQRKRAYGGILALRAHCALLLDYVPPKEPLGTPLGNTLRIRRPQLDWRGP